MKNKLEILGVKYHFVKTELTTGEVVKVNRHLVAKIEVYSDRYRSTYLKGSIAVPVEIHEVEKITDWIQNHLTETFGMQF